MAFKDGDKFLFDSGVQFSPSCHLRSRDLHYDKIVSGGAKDACVRGFLSQ